MTFSRCLLPTLLGLSCVGLTFVGCENKKPNAPVARQLKSSSTAESRAGNVADAINYLSLLMRLDRSMAVREVTYQLNSWAQAYKPDGKWQTPDLVQTMSATSQESPVMQGLASVQFDESECEYLLQCKMMKQVNEWVLRNDYFDVLFADWVADTGKQLSEVDRQKLADATKLFDWTIRNVALDGEARDAESLTVQPQWPLDDTEIGYRQLPWQTMIFGRGDAWQRARVFTQLLQQADMTACVLALEDTDSKQLKLWCLGVPIAGEIYLFEPRWGLPLPGPGEQGIATLRQTQEDRNILRRANLPGQFDYPVSFADLKQLVALVDLEPFAFSHSMYAVEPILTGKNRMNVYVNPVEIREQIAASVAPDRIRLWDMPLMAVHYNMSVRSRIFDQSPFSMQYLATYGAFFTDTLMSTARKDHFEGKFEKTGDQVGALRNYMSIRVDDATLDKLSFDSEVQNLLSVRRGKSETREAFLARIEQVKAFYRVAKYHTSTFLGVAQMELGNIPAAIDWLDNRTLQVADTQAWHPHAEYLLARCYELQGNNDRAMEYLKREKNPQEAGNRIRARLLQARPNSKSGS